ncbi:MAG: cytochrome c3 family protein [Nitrospirota bacterium]|nr:MAG: cytochrome c3 family protein [Nitrospirota bacterium]
MRSISIILILAFILAGAIMSNANTGPEKVVFEPTKGKVTFFHFSHQGRISDCQKCHHNGVEEGPCRKCHDGSKAERFMRKTHILCRNCHKTKGLSTSCTFCHKK